MYVLIYKSRDYTLQSNSSNIMTMLLLERSSSVTALVSTYINTDMCMELCLLKIWC